MSTDSRLRTLHEEIAFRDGSGAIKFERGQAYPRLTVTAEGIDDVYRLARLLEKGQVEFGAIGRRTLRGLDRRWPGIVRRLVAKMGPSQYGYPGVRPRTKRP